MWPTGELAGASARRLLKRVQYQHTVTPITLLSFSKFCEKEHFKAAPRVRPQEKQEKPLPPPTPEPALERLPSVSSEPTMVIELDPDTVDALEGVFVLYSMEYSFDERNSEEVLSLDGFTSLISKVGLLEPGKTRLSNAIQTAFDILMWKSSSRSTLQTDSLYSTRSLNASSLLLKNVASNSPTSWRASSAS